MAFIDPISYRISIYRGFPITMLDICIMGIFHGDVQ